MATTEDRLNIAEMVAWLKSDLFHEEPYESQDGTAYKAFRNPGNYLVVFSANSSGWILDPDGSAIIVSSRLDVQMLDEYLP